MVGWSLSSWQETAPGKLSNPSQTNPVAVARIVPVPGCTTQDCPRTSSGIQAQPLPSTQPTQTQGMASSLPSRRWPSSEVTSVIWKRNSGRDNTGGIQRFLPKLIGPFASLLHGAVRKRKLQTILKVKWLLAYYSKMLRGPLLQFKHALLYLIDLT